MKQKQPKKILNKIKNFNITEFTFLRDLILVKAIRPVDDSGLIDPEQYEDKPEFGEVIKTGFEVKYVKVGDIIRYGKYSTENIRINGEDYYIISEEDCSCILK